MLLSGLEGTVTIHCYRPVLNQHLRVRWFPACIDLEGNEVVDAGTVPVKETIVYQQILAVADFVDGWFPIRFGQATRPEGAGGCKRQSPMSSMLQPRLQTCL